jgi:hypothetical protein
LAVDMDLSHETNGSHGLSNSSKFLEMLLEKSLQDNCSPKIDDSDFAPMCDGVSEERRVVPLKCSSPLSVLIRDVRVPTGIDMDSENHERIYRVVCVASLVGPRKKLDHASCNEQIHRNNYTIQSRNFLGKSRGTSADRGRMSAVVQSKQSSYLKFATGWKARH